ncbi:nitroreductase/quinone reductase family protein [Aldersonia kunmingensis]|uniref:nitroreductase/quinone reductase family protein n=1 Tax=Aldersonia kunmingensis TaxID=408066 RepID=UPI00082B924F|nr:nitroreductase/quinone reductase family protein [Aldersonia kunmingensis]
MTNPDRITPPRWLKPMNRVLLLVRRVGVMRELHVLTVPGRRSGKPRRTPLTVATVGGSRYVVEGFPGADWPRNVRAADGLAELSSGKSIERVRLVEVDAAEAKPVLRAWPAQDGDGAKIMLNAGVVEDVTPDAFEKLAGRCAVFRVETA